eukprot:535821-Rhodomonas_salina.1
MPFNGALKDRRALALEEEGEERGGRSLRSSACSSARLASLARLLSPRNLNRVCVLPFFAAASSSASAAASSAALSCWRATEKEAEHAHARRMRFSCSTAASSREEAAIVARGWPELVVSASVSGPLLRVRTTSSSPAMRFAKQRPPHHHCSAPPALSCSELSHPSVSVNTTGSHSRSGSSLSSAAIGAAGTGPATHVLRASSTVTPMLASSASS